MRQALLWTMGCILLVVIFFIVECFDAVVSWFTSPRGNLVWDILLQIMTIIFTYTVIRRYFDHKEESRWRFAKQNLYSMLFTTAEFLVITLTPKLACQSKMYVYFFGELGAPSRLGNCRSEFNGLNFKIFIDQASNIIHSQSKLLLDSQRQLGILLAQSGVAMAREPELNSLATKLNYYLGGAVREIKEQLDSANSDEPSEDDVRKMAIEIRFTAIAAYDLWEWLAKQATATQDWTATAKELEQARISRSKETSKEDN